MKIEKEKMLEVKLVSENQRMHYSGSVDGQDFISIDYMPPFGDNLGYTSLELLLLALASCVASTVTTMLRSNGVVITRTSCMARGIRRQEHPKGFTSIELDFVFESDNLKNDDAKKTIRIARESVAPVWCMLRESVPVTVHYQITNAGALNAA